MKLVVQRELSSQRSTLGRLYVNGEFECDTLEDVIREQVGTPVANWKIKGATAIPAGTYKVVAQNSPRFGADTLTVLDVPGFDYIRVHAGNTSSDTDGCLLVGTRSASDPDFVSNSRKALAALKDKVLPALKAGEPVAIIYVNP